MSRNRYSRYWNSIFLAAEPLSHFPGGISAILSAIAENFKLTNPETTIEANPGTVDIERLMGYRNAGINRLSIGVQSFNDRLLSNLGRSHNSKEALNAFESARKQDSIISVLTSYIL